MMRGLGFLVASYLCVLPLILGKELPQTNLLMIMFDDLRTELKYSSQACASYLTHPNLESTGVSIW